MWEPSPTGARWRWCRRRGAVSRTRCWRSWASTGSPSSTRCLRCSATWPGAGERLRRRAALRYSSSAGKPVDIEAVRAGGGWTAPARVRQHVRDHRDHVFATCRRLPPQETARGANGRRATEPGANIRRSARRHGGGGARRARRPWRRGDREIHQSGPQLAQGYLNRPELTAARYPLLDVPETERTRRYYRSGTSALVRPDGTLEYAGRVDEQVRSTASDRDRRGWSTRCAAPRECWTSWSSRHEPGRRAHVVASTTPLAGRAGRRT